MTSRAPVLALAAAASGAMIAFQVAGKATRDALFLSSFPVTSLPSMVIAAALVSVAVVLWASRVMAARGPRRLMPALFLVSAVLLVVERGLVGAARPAVAVAVYLHFAALGALLISGFWSLVNERFDPRTAKRMIGRIGAAGTIGGVGGGVLAERVGALGGIEAMLPILAGLHVFCAVVVRLLSGSQPPARLPEPARKAPPSTAEGIAMVARLPMLRNLLLITVLATVSEGLLDYVFKRQATLGYQGDELLRLFAAFYTGVALLTVATQSVLARPALERLGLARTVATLPLAVGAGSLGGLIAPGLLSAGLARGAEAVLHNSLFRSGYELLFTPIRKEEKRATKTLLDVGAVRLGDVAGGGLVQLGIVIAADDPGPMLLLVALILAVASVVVARRLQAGYRDALERNLVARAGQVADTPAGPDPAMTGFIQTINTLDLRQLAGGESLDIEIDRGAGEPADGPAPPGADPFGRRVAALHSGEAARVRRALEAAPVDPVMAPHVIPLLAWDEVAGPALRALREAAPAITGQLLDALLDPEQEFAVRRRIPGILAGVPSQLAMDGLLAGLADRRFEVRYRCGRALAGLHEADPGLLVDERRVFAAVLREVTVDRRIWESQRLLDRLDDSPQPFIDDFLRDRAGRSMEHVFTVLSLALPAQPLRVAFRGLFTEDEMLRGTALEYLETALPAEIRGKLWPHLEDRRAGSRPPRPREEILDQLLQSNESISLSLAEIRRRLEG